MGSVMLIVSILNDYHENWEARAQIKCDPPSYSTKTSYTLSAETRWVENTLATMFSSQCCFSIFRIENILPGLPNEDNPGIYLWYHPGLVIQNIWNWLHEQMVFKLKNTCWYLDQIASTSLQVNLRSQQTLDMSLSSLVLSFCLFISLL